MRGESEEAGVATSGERLGEREGSRIVDEPENLKGKDLEVERGGKLGEEQGRGEDGTKERKEGEETRGGQGDRRSRRI